MSAINVFAFDNILMFPRTRCACACVFAEDVRLQLREPAISARWRVETDADGSRRLVRQWFRNEDEVARVERSSR